MDNIELKMIIYSSKTFFHLRAMSTFFGNLNCNKYTTFAFRNIMSN